MSKYNSRKCEYEGITFDSKKEMKRYIFLKEMEKQGKIRNLKRQVKYVLIDAKREPSTYNSKGREILGKVIERECAYIADFQYVCEDSLIVEDVKGYRMGGAYSVFTIKRKLMLDRYGIRVNEV